MNFNSLHEQFFSLHRVIEEMTKDECQYIDEDLLNFSSLSSSTTTHMSWKLNLITDEKAKSQKYQIKLICDAKCITNVKLDLPN